MLLILAATPLETRLLRHQLEREEKIPCGNTVLRQGDLSGQRVMIGHNGIGAMLTAMQLTRILLEHRPEAVILCGCGGSYPVSGLGNGDLALADSEIYGDCGIATENGFLPLAELDIPQQAASAPVFHQQYPLKSLLLQRAASILPDAALGAFVTVNCCSGTTASSLDLARRTGGICENMEGAAAAQVCAEFSLPLLELRGISNPTGTRDPHQWDIHLGAEVAQQAVLTLLRRGIL